MENTAPKKKLFYGWLCVVGCFFCSASMGIQYSIFSLFVIPVTEELGCTRAQFTMILTIFSSIAMFGALFSGRFLSKGGKVRTLLWIGAIGHLIVYIGYSFSSSLTMFYVFAVVLGISCQMSNAVCINHIIGKWFIDKKGLATGIAYCGSGICLLVMSPLVQSVIDAAGWRWGYRTIAIGIIVFMGICLLTVRENPESMGLKPLGWEKAQEVAPVDAVAAPAEEVKGITFVESLKSPLFYMFVGVMMLMFIIPQAINPNMSPVLQSAGFTAMQAATVLSVSNLLQIPAKIGVGVLFDKMGKTAAAITQLIMMIVAPVILLLLVNNGTSMAWLIIPLDIFYALNYTLINMAPPVNSANIFGRKEFTMFIGVCLFSMLFANTFAGRIVASSFDTTGSYAQGLTYLVFIAIASFVLMMLCYPVSKKIMAKKYGKDAQ